MTLLAIDGPAGAGKTTLAAKLEQDLLSHSTVKVIHMDDLYNGWDAPFSTQLTSVLETIVQAHRDKIEFSIRKFNWKTMQFDAEELIAPTDVLIIEGVGAAQKVIRDAGATTYWLEIEPEIGLARVLARDGAQIEEQMRKWQIEQEIHFAADQTREFAEFKLTS